VLEAISGLVTIGMLGLSAVVGLRLVRLAQRDGGGPVLHLGLYFLVYSALATGLSLATYLGWSSASLALPDRVARILNGAFFVTATVGMCFLLLFTQRTFRPESQAARTMVWGIGGLMALATALLAATEGFEVRVVNGPAYWVHFAARVACWSWVAGESLAYWSKQRRRLALGLADPVVTNRFLLWGVWGLVIALLAFSDPVARLWYYQLAGTATQWIPEVGRPIIDATVPIACGLNGAALVLMILTFFPTPAYRRWLLARQTPTP
jgi:hypothetical protein